MWVFTSKGFLSIVTDKDDDEMRLVRARRRSDLEALFGDDEIFEDKRADYRFRLFAHADDVAGALAREALEMSYTNFKSSIPAVDPAYHDVCMAVWSEMRRLQGTAKINV